ncbi:uncharacterized protein BX664DRAFT_379911 [Halteromyces radiatus]|uniref:uncharacterized protein n=1 Tax=Halteromyces radiatus TaxID=101107 RepID=UPI00221F9A7A|nr:uncharacterized protein BX664DRAFT_379911 [Halteromyces radiatus]KAI8086636.1 hypothetical protein BX664DRAFT_379911 [Halteromyces radiatus]
MVLRIGLSRCLQPRIMVMGRRMLTTERPRFSTNPYSESLHKLKQQGKLAVKVTGYTLLSVTAATALIWQSYHWYIEYCSPSPPGLNYKARQLLHGAYFREQVVPDHRMAAAYLEHVLQMLEEEQYPNQDDMVQLRLRLAWNETMAGELLDAITHYTQAWTSLVTNNNNKKKNVVMITTAQQLGNLYLKIGDLAKAEEYLTWALYALQEQQQQQMTRMKIDVLCSLASVYAMQRQFHLALPLFLQALQAIPEQEENKDEPWLCIKAILQNQLCETFYGMGKKDEAMGWAQAALMSCSDGLATYPDVNDCRECGAVVSNNLGKMLELKGELDQAWTYYKQALMYASTLDDSTSQIRYNDNINRLARKLNKDQDTTSAQDLLPKQEDTTKKSKTGWTSWWRRDNNNNQ